MDQERHARRLSTRSLSISDSSILATRGAANATSLPTTKTKTKTKSDETDRPKNETMFFAEFNPYSPVTVVMLHVVFSCHLEWNHVWPKLPEYHLLIPDLPCHSGSRRVCDREDFTVELCADMVAEMIRQHAHDGRAHIVGVSLGGYVAMDLIRRYPDLVESAFVSGAYACKGYRLASTKYPRLVYAILWSVLHSPGYFFFKVSGFRGDYHDHEMLEQVKRNGSARLADVGISVCVEWQEDRMISVGKRDIRMCMVAGGQQDSVEEVCDSARLIKAQSKGGEGGETCAFVVRDAIHAWHMQFPSSFAKGIQAWIERRPMPEDFEKLPI